eukprot:TRINITY_DN725_c0_g2_i3.p1 TRINITY_DN725_c0_g2~~TRINITY_DN725_c0_g2_i3.p1  ORF type:complete len:1433 (+),score=116.30 TRINITY_DN725_c0_g2_i3:171-4301(+)
MLLIGYASTQSCTLPVKVNPSQSRFTVASDANSTFSAKGVLGVEISGIAACPQNAVQLESVVGIPNTQIKFIQDDFSFRLEPADALTSRATEQISFVSEAWIGNAFSFSFVAPNSRIVIGSEESVFDNDLTGTIVFDDASDESLLRLSDVSIVANQSDVLEVFDGNIEGEVLFANGTFDATVNIEELEQFCQIPANVASSSFTVQGSAGLFGEILRRPDETDIPIEFSGIINLLIEGECPEKIPENARFQLMTEEQGIVVSPQVIGLALGELATVDIRDLMVYFRSGTFTSADDFNITSNVNITQGQIELGGLVSITESLIGATSTAKIVGNVQDSGAEVLLNAVQFSSNVTIEETLPDTSITVTATINLQGQFQAVLDLDQATLINLNVVPESTSQTSEPTKQVSIQEEDPAPLGSQLLQQRVPTLPDGSCPVRFQPTELAGVCSCAQGFDGLGCNQCLNADACAAWLLPDPDDSRREETECSEDVKYIATSQMKAYKCEVDGEAQDIVAPGSLSFVCQTHGFPYRLDASAGLGGRLETAGTTPQTDQAQSQEEAVANCRIGFAVKGTPPIPINCVTTDCTFVVDSPNVECRKTKCNCVDDDCSQGVQEIIDQVVNGVKLIKQAGVQYEVILEDLSVIKLFGQCSVGECRYPGLVEVVGDGSIDVGNGYDKEYLAIVAAIPLLILVINCAVATFYILANYQYWKPISNSYGAEPIGEGIVDDNRFESDENSQSVGNSNQVGKIVQDIEYQISTTQATVVNNGSSGSMDIEKRSLLLYFNNIQCRVPSRVLLCGVDGIAYSKEVMGVMGPSGSGKTTLLSILAYQNQDLSSQSAVGGTISLGQETRSQVLRKVIGFVPQFDNLLPTLTVQETVRYAALMRLPLNLSAAEINDRMCVIFSELGLWNVVNSKVGGHGIRGISGGERKRVAIGMAMVTDPPCLIMDEPTSGLDSFTAAKLIDTCKGVAMQGRIIIMSLHQPSPDMFMRLDKVLLLAAGHKVYLGTPNAAAEYFSQLGYACGQNVPIAEHMLSIVQQPENLYKVLDSVSPVLQVEPKDLQSIESAVALNQYLQTQDSSRSVVQKFLNFLKKFLRRLAVLFWRTGIEMIRNPTLMLLHWIMGLGMGLVVGLVFLDVKDDISGAQNRAGVVFFSLCLFAFSTLTIVDLLMSERLLVVREVRSRYYGMFPYFLVKLSLDGLLLRAVPVLLYTCLLYPLMGLRAEALRIALWCIILILFSCTIGALSMAITSVVKTPGQANLVMNILLLLMVLVAGYLVNKDSMPGFTVWLHYCSVFSYAFEALIVNEVLGMNLVFTVQDIGSAIVDGKLFLNTLSLDEDEQDMDVYLILAFYVVFSVVALCLMIGASEWKSFLTSRRKAYKPL